MSEHGGEAERKKSISNLHGIHKLLKCLFTKLSSKITSSPTLRFHWVFEHFIFGIRAISTRDLIFAMQSFYSGVFHLIQAGVWNPYQIVTTPESPLRTMK
jgi:hypothetical protein